MRTSKRKAPIGPQQEQIEYLETLTFILCVLIASLTITVFVLSVRFSGFRDFVIDIIHRQSVIFQNLSKVLC
ncbi:Uncharacterised protein [uncultured Ruminococcus sp.]|nr:Uncharacterised protein [uncultured Ruminococcus sp.]